MTDTENLQQQIQTTDDISPTNDNSTNYTLMKANDNNDNTTTKNNDTNGDGSVLQDEIYDYIIKEKTRAGRYKWFFIISLFLFFLSIFGVFLLGFEVARLFDINENETSDGGARKLTDRHGKELSTIIGLTNIEVENFWDSSLEPEDKIVTNHRATYGDIFINCHISRTEVIDNVTTLYDYTGYVWFEYHRNGFNYTYNDTGISVEGYWIMYQLDFDGNVVVTPNEEDTSRRFVEVPSGAKKMQFTPTPNARTFTTYP